MCLSSSLPRFYFGDLGFRFFFLIFHFVDFSDYVCVWLEDGDGRITGNDATKFFSMATLSRIELKQVDFFFLLFLYYVIFVFSFIGFHFKMVWFLLYIC